MYSIKIVIASLVLTFSILHGQSIEIKKVDISNITEDQFKYIYAIGYNESLSQNYFPLLSDLELVSNNNKILSSKIEDLNNNFDKQLANAKLLHQLELDRKLITAKYAYDKRNAITSGVIVGLMSTILIGTHLIKINPYTINLSQ